MCEANLYLQLQKEITVYPYGDGNRIEYGL